MAEASRNHAVEPSASLASEVPASGREPHSHGGSQGQGDRAENAQSTGGDTAMEQAVPVPSRVSGIRVEHTPTRSGSTPVASIPNSEIPRSSSYPRPRFLPIVPIADGGMANVELAVGLDARNFKKLAVLKTLRQELAFDPDLVAMFLSEARLCARLNHANLVQVYEVLEGPRPCIVMEYLEGLSMFEIHRALGDAFEPSIQLRILCDVLAGLHYAHELTDYDGTPLGIVHRDVSPQNIVVTFEGRVKVVDFGIAKMANSPSFTLAGMVKGKMPYMAPEQLAGENIDRRTDVFSVGCMLWRAASGKKLWAKMPPEDIMRALVLENVPPPSVHGDIDPRLEAIVVRATAPNRNDRFESAEALRCAVEEYLAETTPDVDLRDFMQKTFAEQAEEKRRAIARNLAEATSIPPLELSALPSTPVEAVSSKRDKLVTLGIVGAAVSLLLLAAIAIVWRLDTATSTNDRARATAGPRELVIRVQAEPAAAHILLDGKELSGNPVEARVEAGSEHFIEVTLPGYRTIARKQRFDREARFEFVLVPEELTTSAPPEPAAFATPPTSSSPTVTPAAGAAVPRKPGKAKKRVSCEVPFYFQNGIKFYKPECL